MRELFRAENLPVLQNRTFETAAEAKASGTGDVVLVQDERTGLVYNAAFDPSLLSYDREYQNEQACSPIFQRHLDEVATILGRHFKGRRLIEVGCGKGYFLEHLRGLGYDVTGIDPAYEGDNPYVIKAPFERGLGLSAEALVLRHVLEHIPDPVSFLSAIAHANAGRGAIYIEVPCFDWILQHRCWFDIFYEHVNYFRLSDFDRMFSRIYERGHVFGGQYVYLVADLASLRRPDGDSNDISMPPDFLSGITRTVSMIRAGRGRRYAIWGAASKGVIFSVYLQRAGIGIDEAIDINPAKQGRFLPCSAIKVSAPEDAARRLDPEDCVFVMNSNYLDEITAQSNGRYTYYTVDHE
jgi:SAM-dependent methyltransferase